MSLCSNCKPSNIFFPLVPPNANGANAKTKGPPSVHSFWVSSPVHSSLINLLELFGAKMPKASFTNRHYSLRLVSYCPTEPAHHIDCMYDKYMCSLVSVVVLTSVFWLRQKKISYNIFLLKPTPSSCGKSSRGGGTALFLLGGVIFCWRMKPAFGLPEPHKFQAIHRAISTVASLHLKTQTVHSPHTY